MSVFTTPSVSTVPRANALVPLARQLAATAGAAHASLILADDTEEGGLRLTRTVSVPDGIIEALVGFDAPAQHSTIGVLSPAVARTCEGETDIGVAVLVHRNGSSVAAVHPLSRARPWVNDPAESGRLADLCRRALGLPTPPPSVQPAVLWAVLWLDRIVATAAANPSEAGRWASLAALHPLVGSAAHAARTPDPIDIVAMIERHPLAALDWDAVRRDAADGSDHAGSGLASSDAAWFDGGSFARWVLSSYGSMAELLDLCGELVPVGTESRVRRVLAITAPDALPTPR